MGYSKTLNLGPSYILSDNLLASNDTLKAISWASYAKTKSFQIIKEVYQKSSLRIKFDIASGAGTTYGKIYLNGVSVGVEKVKAGAFATQTDDIVFTTLSEGDNIELWTYNDASNGSCQNFRLYGNESFVFNNEV
jgi:hypothetical protein